MGDPKAIPLWAVQIRPSRFFSFSFEKCKIGNGVDLGGLRRRDGEVNIYIYEILKELVEMY